MLAFLWAHFAEQRVYRGTPGGNTPAGLGAQSGTDLRKVWVGSIA